MFDIFKISQYFPTLVVVVVVVLVVVIIVIMTLITCCCGCVVSTVTMDPVSVTSSDVSEHKFQLPETSRLKIF